MRVFIGGMAALLLLVGGACSDDDTDSGAPGFTVVGTEMAFEAPARVKAGAHDVVFRNDGAVPHELAFRTPSGRFVARRSIASATKVTMKVTLEPGDYELGCFEPGHYEAGMHRRLTVDP